MIKTSATNLRNHLFEFLEKVQNGETIVIHRNKKDVAKLITANKLNWRDQMKIKAELLVPPDEIIKPIEEIWQDYI